jgi:hypothetical protein
MYQGAVLDPNDDPNLNRYRNGLVKVVDQRGVEYPPRDVVLLDCPVQGLLITAGTPLLM